MEECFPRRLVEHNFLGDEEAGLELVDHDGARAGGGVEGGVLFWVGGGDDGHQVEPVLHVDAGVPDLRQGRKL